MGAWHRWGIVLLALAIALPAAILGKGGEGGPIKEKDTACWPCHVGWPDPLKTFYTIIPPPEAGAPVGEEFDYVVQVQNPWLQAVTFLEPSLSIGAAPSLQFCGGPEPIDHLVLPGTVPLTPDPTNPTAPFAGSKGFVSFVIPVGVTYIDVLLQPIDTQNTGPKFTMDIFTGTTTPGATPIKSINASGNGQAAELQLITAGDVAKFGTGNWTIQARLTDGQSVGVPHDRVVPFNVIVNARAETSDVTTLIQPQNVNIAKHSSFLFTYCLKASQPPGGDEVLGLQVNGTMYYEHDDKNTDDWANVTKAFDKPLRVQTAADGSGRVVVLAPADAGFVIVQPKNGASIDTVSEAVGYGSALLLISSVWTGGMFGKASRRQLNSIFGSAKRRVAFHNFLSYGILLFASIHTVLFILETAYYWTLGVLWGGLAILSMLGLGITGAWQVGMIRRWNYATWRWSHYGLAVAAIVFTLAHMALDGVHFAFVQEALHWNDPLDPRSVTK